MNDDRLKNYIENILFINLCGLAIILFFSAADRGLIKLFSIGALLALITGRYVLRNEIRSHLPKTVLITSLLFLLSVTISTIYSEDQYHAFIILKNYRFILLAGLLFTAPLDFRKRKIILIIVFGAAAAAGALGIIQYSGLAWASNRPAGFCGNPNFYAGPLAIVSGSAMLMLFLPEKGIFKSKGEIIFLTIVVLFSLTGVILSQSRSLWVALFVAPLATLLLRNPKKALIMLIVFIVIAVSIYFGHKGLKNRAVSIVTSSFTEDVTGSTGIRLELWKASLLIFRKHPLLGAGVGDFELSVQKLIHEKKIKQIVVSHAHNIFLQTLATQGIVGFSILIALLLFLIGWGLSMINAAEFVSGHIIVMITLITIVGGMTDNHIEFSMFLASACLMIGLSGHIDKMQSKIL